MSNENQETIEDIVAEMRQVCHNQTLGVKTNREKSLEKLLKDMMLEYVCRIEAAAKREREAGAEAAQICGEIGEMVGREALKNQSVTNCNRLGNAAKMSEALEQIHELLSIGGNPDTAMCIRYEAAYQIAAEAISSPTRNCDRFTNAKDALKAFERETGESMAIEFIKWLFSEAKEEAK